MLRKADNKECALKFIEPKHEIERAMIYNEIALMNMSKVDEYVNEIFESFDYMNRLWIFIELMDYAMTPIIEDMYGKYSENCCKYILKQTLLGRALLCSPSLCSSPCTRM